MPKPTYGEKKRLAEKEKYRELAEAQYFVKKAEKLRNIPDQLDEKTSISPETRAALNAIADELVELNAAWKEYLGAYLDVSKTKDAENAKERRSMRKLLDGFNKISNQMKDLENDPVAEREEFAECYAEVLNYAGHYNEMTNGTLVVPEMTEEQKSKIITVKKEINVVSKYSREQIEVYFRQKNVVSARFGYSDKLDAPLFPHEPTPDDIMQGNVGDCYFIAALASVAANNPQMIRDMMKDNGDGTVTVRLYDEKKNGKLEPIYVNVEKSTPVYKLGMTNGSEVRSSIGAHGSLWVQMLEKAFAAANIHRSNKKRFSETMRSYSDIESGFGDLAFRVLAGRQNIKNEEIVIKKHYTNTDNPRVMNELFKKIRGNVVDRNIIIASAGDEYMDKKLLKEYNTKLKNALALKGKTLKTISENELIKLGEDIASKVFCGAVVDIDGKTGAPKFSNHSYTLIDAYEKDGKKYVLVRNPHAKFGYKEGEESSWADKGYCEIPLERFAGIFRRVYTAKPLEPKDYQDFSLEYHKPLSKLYQGLLGTTPHSSSFMQWLTLSKESRNLKNALREIQKIQEQKFPSKHAMMEAYEKLDKAAKAYLEKHKDDNVADMKDETNRRITIAKASMALSGSFLGHMEKGRDVQADIHRIGRMMVTERGVFVTQKFSQSEQLHPQAPSVFTDARVNKALMQIDGDKLFDIAFEKHAHEIPDKVIKELTKVANEKQSKTEVQKEEVKENVKQTENVVVK